MKVKSSSTVSASAKDKQMSLIGLLFFLLGAIDLYHFFRVQNSRDTFGTNRELSPWLATGLLATVMLGVVEILVL